MYILVWVFATEIKMEPSNQLVLFPDSQYGARTTKGAPYQESGNETSYQHTF